MKKALCLICCLLCCLSATACRNQSAEEAESSPSSSTRLVDTLPSSGEIVRPDSSSLPDLDPSVPKPESSDGPSTPSSSKASSKPTTSSPSQQGPSSSSSPATSSTPEKKQVTVTIPEGYTFAQIAEKLEANGVCTKQQLLDTVNSYDYSYYPLIAAQAGSSNRCFRLEGYLFPDTYQFYTNMKPQDALGKFLRNAENKISSSDRSRAAQMGYSLDQILTIASLIQGEAGNPDQLAKVSSVIYNRLKAGMKLQLDASINYVEKSIKPYITGDKNRYNAAYNTYKCPALPAGPICNPGSKWIHAALFPADTDYLYFVNDANGNYYFAATYEEHLENCKKAGIPPA